MIRRRGERERVDRCEVVAFMLIGRRIVENEFR
jgi:hypothetical protein